MDNMVGMVTIGRSTEFLSFNFRPGPSAWDAANDVGRPRKSGTRQDLTAEGYLIQGAQEQRIAKIPEVLRIIGEYVEAQPVYHEWVE